MQHCSAKRNNYGVALAQKRSRQVRHHIKYRRMLVQLCEDALMRQSSNLIVMCRHISRKKREYTSD